MKETCDRIKAQLGPEAKLGAQLFVLNQEGEILVEKNYDAETMLPLASTKKIVIALAALKKIFCTGEASLQTELLVGQKDFSPGRPTNSMDSRFFIPWASEIKQSIDVLLNYMLQQSDNTSADVLLEFAGGIESINHFVENELKLPGFKLSYSSKELLSFFYGVEHGSRLGIGREFLSAYTIRVPKEKIMLEQEFDVCTPLMMAELLKLLVIKYIKNESWIAEAAKVIFEKMQYCTTGENLIKKGAKGYLNQIDLFGSKQGSVGGIRNDTAFVHLHDGRWVIISIHTCLSNLSYQQRDEIIAELSQFLLNEFCDLTLDNIETNSVSWGKCSLV